MRVAVFTALLPAVHSLPSTVHPLVRKSKDDQLASRSVGFLEVYASLLLPTTYRKSSIHTSRSTLASNSTSTSTISQGAFLATTTESCHSTVTSNSAIGTGNAVTSTWTSGMLFGSGLLGPAPSSTAVASTGLIATFSGSAWQWPVLSNSAVTTARPASPSLVASASPSAASSKPSSISHSNSASQDLSAQPSVSTLLSYLAPLHPSPITTTSTSSDIAASVPPSATSLKPHASSASPSLRNISQHLPGHPSASSLPCSAVSLTWNPAPPPTSSTFQSSTSTCKKLVNTSFYESLIGLPSRSGSQTKSFTIPTISPSTTKSTPAIVVVPITTVRIPSTWTASLIRPVTLPDSILSLATGQPQVNETLTQDADPTVITSVMRPDSRCPYPYPGIYCGKTKTTLITKTVKTEEKPKTSDPGCPYPSHDILC